MEIFGLTILNGRVNAAIDCWISFYFPEIFIDAIQKIKGVRDVSVQENLLLINTDADLRAKISKAVVQHDFPLIQMKVQQFSLDDIYMKYFKEA